MLRITEDHRDPWSPGSRWITAILRDPSLVIRFGVVRDPTPGQPPVLPPCRPIRVRNTYIGGGRGCRCKVKEAHKGRDECDVQQEDSRGLLTEIPYVRGLLLPLLLPLIVGDV
jgi:hypothetical protein